MEVGLLPERKSLRDLVKTVWDQLLGPKYNKDYLKRCSEVQRHFVYFRLPDLSTTCPQ